MVNQTIKKTIAVKLILLMLATVIASPIALTPSYGAESSGSIIADRNKCDIILPEGEIIVDQPLVIKATGDRVDRYGAVDGIEGETVLIPRNLILSYKTWNDTIRSVTVKSPDYSHTFTAEEMYRYGTYEVDVYYDKYIYEDGHWQRDYNEPINTFNFEVRGKAIPLTFHPNGGKVSLGKIEVIMGQKYGTLPTPTWSGYRFLGWYTSPSGGERIESTDDVNEDIHTLYARWERRITVNFNAYGGKVSTKSKVILYKGKYNTLPTPKRSKYLFMGWYTSPKGGKKITASSAVTNFNSHTLYARWLGPKGSGKTITKKEYSRIKNGLTYSQVKFLVGGSGQYVGKEKNIKFYYWKGKGTKKGFALVGFKNGKSVGKYKEKLKK